MDEKLLYTLPVVIFGILAIGVAIWLARDVLSRDRGTPGMQDISDRIFEGAVAYLNRQYRTIFGLAIVVAILMGILVAIFENEHQTARGVVTAMAFLVGAALSGISGFIGMYVAVKSNVRTAAAAQKGTGAALVVALRGGAVSGFLVIALGLLGVLGVYGVVYQFAEGDVAAVAETPFWIVGFAFGASFVALFAQLGGGIYTKAADVGADLVGKVEAGIPEDDPRNPATIADNVGDNVGDCAGMAADLFESYEVTLVASIILGVAGFKAIGANPALGLVFPLAARAIGVIASIAGVFAVRAKEGETNALRPINKGFLTAGTLTVLGTLLVALFYVGNDQDNAGWKCFGAVAIGLVLAQLISRLTEYYTGTEHSPVQEVAESSETGPATVVLSGTASGLES
ncbi:MAG TPA: sodium/proton-translocating pyrophosphatase, partial [Thermomicrobiales bacterium]|nr:sodium/proton-translocating pyrophosphatase [Thermomicrobiales bacterium]